MYMQLLKKVLIIKISVKKRSKQHPQDTAFMAHNKSVSCLGILSLARLGADVPAKAVVLGWGIIHSPMDFVRISSPVRVGKGFLPAVWPALPTTPSDDLLRKQTTEQGRELRCRTEQGRLLLMSLSTAVPEPTLASASPVIKANIPFVLKLCKCAPVPFTGPIHHYYWVFSTTFLDKGTETQEGGMLCSAW